jgi:hypothetical protein
MIKRRSLVKSLGLTTALSPLLQVAQSRAGGEAFNHILCTCSHSQIAVTLSTHAVMHAPTLRCGSAQVTGYMIDSEGKHWRFLVQGLEAATEYSLQVYDGSNVIGEAWPLRTFPAPDVLPDQFKLLSYTCAGGGDGFGFMGRQYFKPLAFKRRLLAAALAEKPDAGLAIGDHVYWDLRGHGIPQIGRKKPLLKWALGHYLRWKFGEFDRSAEMIGTDNEPVLKAIGQEQIAALYGTDFKSVPMFFIGDDHDYFENDDAEKDLVTFPADAFSKRAAKAMADLYYPALLQGPETGDGRLAGRLRYGQLFDGVLLDCAGGLTLGEDARLVPAAIEQWAIETCAKSSATHFALIPSHPLGYTAGKWREWYPDVVAEEGAETVSNELLGETKGTLGMNADKYLWQKGWWAQHQRLLGALAAKDGSRFMVSGDIHALAAERITHSGDLDLSNRPVTSLLSGPVSSSDGTWPSSARGVQAAIPAWLKAETLVPVTEVNSYTMIEITKESVRMHLRNCGGYDRSLNETGEVLRSITIDV